MTSDAPSIGRQTSNARLQGPMDDAALDRPALIAAISKKLESPERPTGFLMLVSVQQGERHEADRAEDDRALSATLSEHLRAMIRRSDLVAPLDHGELAMVVFDLPPIQRVAFTKGITTAIDALVSAHDPHAVIKIGTASLRHDVSLTESFRAADRDLCSGSVPHRSGNPAHGAPTVTVAKR